VFSFCFRATCSELIGFGVVAFPAVPVDLTVGSVPLTALFAVTAAVELAPVLDVVDEACAWSLAYVVWLTGVDDTGRRVGVTVDGGFVVALACTVATRATRTAAAEADTFMVEHGYFHTMPIIDLWILCFCLGVYTIYIL